MIPPRVKVISSGSCSLQYPVSSTYTDEVGHYQGS